MLDLKNRGTTHNYIKTGSTWFNNWEEWVDKDVSQISKPMSKRDQIMARVRAEEEVKRENSNTYEVGNGQVGVHR